MRILLVEDEFRLSDALSHILKKNNYSVDVTFDGISGEEYIETGIYDLIILDRMLPKKEGIEVLKSIRAKGISTPVIILTAKDSISDKVEGLDAGADDYLIKPFSKEELLARIRALGRRQTDMIKNNYFDLGNFIFDPLKCELYNENHNIKLTLKESQLLELLLRNKNLVITKKVILDRIWGLDCEVEVNNIEVYLSYLRKKFTQIGANLTIETIRGVGYSIRG